MSSPTKRFYLLAVSLIVVSLVVGMGGYAHAAATPTPTRTPTPSAIQLTQTAQAVEATAIQKALAATATATPTPTPTPKAAMPEKAMTLIPVVESPHPYPNYYNESWLISNLDAKAEASRLHFARLELEENVDWLIVMDAYDVEIQRITGFYPDGLWTEPVPGNLVQVRLVSDGSVRQWGFVADAVESVPYKTLAYSPHPYPNYASLKWQFDNLDPNAEGTRLHFSRVELEENVDWLVIMDLTETPYQWITGSHPDGLWTIGVPGNGVIVRLISDSSVRRWGFNLDALESASPEEAQPRLEPEKALAESKHPYEPAVRLEWKLVNPNPAAAFSKVHFTRLDLVEDDSLVLYDGNDNRIQTFGQHTHLRDFWSEDIPGRIVKVQLNSSADYPQDVDWGFRIDDIAPKAEEKPIPAFVTSVRVRLGQPGDLWLNNSHLGWASAPGEYLVRLPQLGENLIAVETLFHKQEVLVYTEKDGSVRIEYSGIQPKGE